MSARTTYTDLTGTAATHLTQALALARQGLGAEPDNAGGDLGAAIHAHRDASAALAHLGRVLNRPPVPLDGAARSRSRRGGPDVRTLRTLARRGQPWDWSAEPPAAGTTARSLWAAARSIRAAADLWATHQTPSGADRSPEASRMRHPSVLGAATREWRALVRGTGEVADALLRHSEQRRSAGPGPTDRVSGSSADPAGAARARGVPAGGVPATASSDDLAPLRDYPRPLVRTQDPARQSVNITVARPGARTDSDALDRIADGIDRVRHAAWQLAEAGTAPVPALANLAAIGVMLNRAAGEALDREAGLDDHATAPGADPVQDRIGAAAARARTTAARWSVVAGLVADLRSPHPPTSALQIERLDLGRLLDQARRAARGPGARQVAEELGRQADRLSEIAALNLRATRAAHERGDLYLLGRALPQESLVRRPDLLEAKLTGRIVPAPAAAVRRLEEAYLAIADSSAGPSARDGSSPAA